MISRLLAFSRCSVSSATVVLLIGLFGCGESIKNKKRAVEALERLNEYKRAGELLYEPRYRDAEITVAEVAEFRTAQHCLMLIRRDRIMQRGLELAFAENKEPALTNAKAGYTKNSESLTQCLIDARREVNK